MADCALKHDPEVHEGGERDLSALPVVPLVSRQVQEQQGRGRGHLENVERSDADSRHVQVEADLKRSILFIT